MPCHVWSFKGASPLKILHSFIVVFVLKGALQELKLYGSPGQAEVQCDNSFQVRNCFPTKTFC